MFVKRTAEAILEDRHLLKPPVTRLMTCARSSFHLFFCLSSVVFWKANVGILATIALVGLHHLTWEELALELLADYFNIWPFSCIERSIDVNNVSTVNGNCNFLK